MMDLHHHIITIFMWLYVMLIPTFLLQCHVIIAEWNNLIWEATTVKPHDRSELRYLHIQIGDNLLLALSCFLEGRHRMQDLCSSK